MLTYMIKPSVPIVFLALTLIASASRAQTCPSTLTAERYTLNGEEVTDKRTGLIWKRCSEGQVWSNTGVNCNGSAHKYTHEAALALAKATNTIQSITGWRLPNVKELSSLVDRACISPSIDSAAFPNTVSAWYWTSTPSATNSAYAWDVSFENGSVGNPTYGGGDRRHELPIRFVRTTPNITGSPGESTISSGSGGGSAAENGVASPSGQSGSTSTGGGF